MGLKLNSNISCGESGVFRSLWFLIRVCKNEILYNDNRELI